MNIATQNNSDNQYQNKQIGACNKIQTLYAFQTNSQSKRFLLGNIYCYEPK